MQVTVYLKRAALAAALVLPFGPTYVSPSLATEAKDDRDLTNEGCPSDFGADALGQWLGTFIAKLCAAPSSDAAITAYLVTSPIAGGGHPKDNSQLLTRALRLSKTADAKIFYVAAMRSERNCDQALLGYADRLTRADSENGFAWTVAAYAHVACDDNIDRARNELVRAARLKRFHDLGFDLVRTVGQEVQAAKVPSEVLTDDNGSRQTVDQFKFGLLAQTVIPLSLFLSNDVGEWLRGGCAARGVARSDDYKRACAAAEAAAAAHGDSSTLLARDSQALTRIGEDMRTVLHLVGSAPGPEAARKAMAALPHAESDNDFYHRAATAK